MNAAEREVVRLKRLAAELAADRVQLEAVWSQVEAFDARAAAPEDPAVDAALALKLEHLYTATEALFSRIAKTFEGSLPDGPTWHADLLRDMSLAIDGVRPAVIGPVAVNALRRLLQFRHFLRHAYAIGLERPRLRDLAAQARAGLPELRADLDRWQAFLRAVIEAEEQAP